jgi:hypothetical protein
MGMGRRGRGRARVRAEGGLPRLEMVQGVYYLLTGLWPLVSMRTFQLITGPKPEGWLVKMVGLLAGVIGASLLAASRRPPSADPALLGGGSAAAFAVVDVWYSLRRRISPVYLLESLPELVFVAAWVRRATRPDR